jgi:hypothetical protein
MRRPTLACQVAGTDVTQTTEKVPSGHPVTDIAEGPLHRAAFIYHNRS